MTERCIDASVAVKWAVAGEPHRNKARALLRDAGRGAIRLIAPPLFVAEVDSVIRRRVFDGKMMATKPRRHIQYWT